MNPAYWLLLGSLLSFAAMGVVHKLGDNYKCNAMAVAVTTMGVAFLLSLLRATLAAPDWWQKLPLEAPLLAVPFGTCAALALWLFQKGLRHGKIVTSWLLINLSTAIPTVLSILVYREQLSLKKGFTLILIVASLVLLWWDRKSAEAKG